MGGPEARSFVEVLGLFIDFELQLLVGAIRRGQKGYRPRLSPPASR